MDHVVCAGGGRLEGLGAVGAQVGPVLGTLPCMERLCLTDSRWVEHLC